MDYDFRFSTEAPSEKAAANTELRYPNILYIGVLILVALSSFLTGAIYERRNTSSASTELSTFWDVWDILERDFYGELPDSEARRYGAINGLVDSLNDPFTSFSPPEIATERRQQLDGHFGGVGIVVRANDLGEVYVQEIIPGNPAEKAGIQEGDIFRAVDAVAVSGLTTDGVANLVRGEVGTTVSLTMFRPSTEETYTVALKRAIIETPTVFSENIEGVGYVRLTTFNGVATSQLEDHLRSLQAEGVRSLILDLRANGGGLLSEAVSVADTFLTEGLILTERRNDGAEQVFRADDGDLAEDLPLVVLVDGGSASASEVVAGALQDRNRALLIGQNTYGKGVVQLVYNLSDGSQLRVTAAQWYTPNERAINVGGLTPDMAIAQPFSPTGDDLVLAAAVDYLNQNYPPDPSEATGEAEDEAGLSSPAVEATEASTPEATPEK